MSCSQFGRGPKTWWAWWSLGANEAGGELQTKGQVVCGPGHELVSRARAPSTPLRDAARRSLHSCECCLSSDPLFPLRTHLPQTTSIGSTAERRASLGRGDQNPCRRFLSMKRDPQARPAGGPRKSALHRLRGAFPWRTGGLSE